MTRKEFEQSLKMSNISRELDTCPGCGKSKDIGLIVCWACFKYREDIIPYKYFEGTFGEWLKIVPENERIKFAKEWIYEQYRLQELV